MEGVKFWIFFIFTCFMILSALVLNITLWVGEDRMKRFFRSLKK
jgi:hypothetical protein